MHRTSKVAFAEMPLEAKAGMILLPLAWLSFLICQALVSGALSMVQLTMAGLCCMLVFTQKSWARWLCGIYNAVLAASMFSQGPAAFGGVLPMAAIVSLFSLATLALLLPGTAAAFRQAAQKQ